MHPVIGTQTSGQAAKARAIDVGRNPQTREPVQVQSSQREMAAFYWSKHNNKMSLDALEMLMGTWPAGTLPKVTLCGILSCCGRERGAWVSGWVGEWVSDLWQHPEYWDGNSETGRRKEIGKEKVRISKGMKGTHFLLTSLRTSMGSLPRNLWESLTRWFPPLGLWAPQWPKC